MFCTALSIKSRPLNRPTHPRFRTLFATFAARRFPTRSASGNTIAIRVMTRLETLIAFAFTFEECREIGGDEKCVGKYTMSFLNFILLKYNI